MKEKVNSYTVVLQQFGIEPEELFDKGFEQIVRINDEIISKGWKKLKDNVENGKETVYVRGHGRDSNKTDILLKLLRKVFNPSIEKDPSNNARPKDILQKAFTDVEYEDYQISHLFEERTNNPLLFGAPWMICYTPKIIDPFTGHETKGFPELRVNFVEKAFKKNQCYIEDYNKIINEKYWPRLKDFFDNNINNPEYSEILQDVKFKKHMIAALAPIKLEYEILTRGKRINSYVRDFNNIFP